MSDSRVAPGSPGCRTRLDSRTAAVCLALFFGTLLLFSRAVRHDFVDLDDPDYVTRNPHVQNGLTLTDARWAFTAGAAGNWHPVTWLSHMLDCQLFGNNPHGHHASNVLWHAFNAVLAFLAFRRLTGAFWTSALSAALFAWHPLRVESVAWVAERKDVLSIFFGLLTLWAYSRYVEGSAPSGRWSFRNPAWRSYGLALLCFTLGLMCKPMLVTFPFLLLLLDCWPLQRMPAAALREPGREASAVSWRFLFLEKAPFFLLSAASCAITYACQKKSGAVVDTLPFGDRLANAVVSITRYLGNYFWPFDLAIGYPRPAHWPLAPIAALLLAIITAIALWQWRRRPWLPVGWLWFLGTLIPVLGLVPVGLQARADRYTYLPVLGLQLAMLWTVREVKVFSLAPWLGPVTAAILLTGCAVRTWTQLAFWQNSETLYQHALAVTQDNYLAHCYLGATLLNQNRPEAACDHFRRAIELKSDYGAARFRLGFALEKMGRDNEALAAYEALLKFKPDDVQARFRCANVLARLNRDGEALPQYEKLIQLEPGFVRAESSYADSLRALNRLPEAEAHYRRALALQSDDAYSHYGLGATLEEAGRPAEALASYRRAVELKPDFADARYNLGVLLLNGGQPAEAIPQFRAAVGTQTNFAAAYVGLGLAEAELNQTAAAVRDLEHALQLDPNAAGVSETLPALREKLVAGAARP